MTVDPSSDCLADEKRPKETALFVHVHSGGVGHCDEQAVASAEREQPPLVSGVERKLGAPGPAGGSARLHQQDGNWVGAHLFIDVLQQGSPSVFRLLAVLALLLQGVGVSEVRLGVDVVQAGLRHHQLPVHQLDVLEEGQPLLPLPP